MEIGQVVHGFELVSLTPVEELNAKLHLLRHQKTGAQLLWTGREDENKTFAIAFQTIPEDDTGVFHILEHSVLCGSDKYPVKEPFVELLKGSLNTFLNAVTFPDKTMYPVSSRNDADFRNLMRVYLDAVFCPAIYHNENIFRQEGWRYEMDPETGLPKYVGVVFGEMKGAFSSVDEIIFTKMMRQIYGESCYGYCSGGDPKHIPELTYEQFINNHRRFYHPTNSKIFLDGSVNLEQTLADIDGEYLSKFSYQEPDFALEMQPARPYSCESVSYAVAPGSDKKNQAHFAMGKIVSTWQDLEKNMAISILQDYLAGSNSAPLTRAVLERGLGQNVEFNVETGIAQCFMLLQVRNTNEDQLENMRREIGSIAQVILDKGLDREELTASLNRMEFRNRERNEPFGLYLGIAAAQSWMYGGDPAMYLAVGKIFDSIRAKLDGSYFEELLREMLLDDEGLAVLHVLPSDTLGQETIEEEQGRLKAAFDSWTEEDKKALEQSQASLTAWQQTPDSQEALASIPHIRLADVPEEPLWTDMEEQTLGGVTVLKPQVSTNGTVYLNLYFALPGIAMEDLGKASLLAQLLGKLPTAHRSEAQLQRDIKMNLGAMNFTVDVVSREGDCDHCVPYFKVSVSVLESKAEEAVKLIREVLLETQLNCPDKINEILQQIHVMMQQRLVMAGHQFAFIHALSGQTAEDMALEQCGGYSWAEMLKEAAADFEKAFPALLEKFQAVQKQFTAANLTLGVTGAMPEASLNELCDCFPAGEEQCPVLAWDSQSQVKKMIPMPAGVAYSSQGINLYRQGYESHGSQQLMSKLVSLNYLWNEVRVQGGAYGAGMSIKPNGSLFCYSFRDPNPARTLGVYKGAAEFLRRSCESGAAMDQLIIGAISDTEPLLSAAAAGQTAIARRLRGITLEQKRQERRELLNATAEDLMKWQGLLETMANQGGVCVIGSEPLVKACEE